MTDMIDREELKKAVDTWDRFYYVPLQGVKRGSNDDYTALVRINDILHCIDTMPAADVQPISHGRWENEYLEDDDVWWADCTNCNNDAHSRFGKVSIYAYCPNCGARMDGEQNDD